MSRITAFAIALLLVPGLVRSPAQPAPIPPHVLQNRDVAALARAGFNEQSILDKMLTEPNRFDTTTGALADLAAQGISEDILRAMLMAKERGAPLCLAGGQSSQESAAPEAGRIPSGGILPEELPRAAREVPYRALIDIRVDGRCPSGNVSLSLAAGVLPRGLRLTISGLDGTPHELGKFRFTIRAANECVGVSRPYELAVDGKPLLETTPEEIAFSSPTPAHAPEPRTILVSSTWPNLPYTVETRNATWLRVLQEHGVTPDQDSAIRGDVVTLTVDPSKLSPGTYRGSVLFWTRHGANAPSVPVVLVVGASQ